MRALVAFLSDFGLEDPYVGVVKAVLLGINPDLRIVDLCHQIPAHDVIGGAFALGSSYQEFPPGTVFLTVVDPGVGSARAGLVAMTDRYAFVAPDNGLLGLVFRDSPETACYRIENPRYFRFPVSRTFHARDIFAPVAAQLSLGLAPGEVGPIHRNPAGLAYPEPFLDAGRLTGQVVHIDRFGNMVTNLDVLTIRRVFGKERVTVRIKGMDLPVLEIYAQAAEGQPLALVGSSGFLEISVNRGDASRLLNAGKGERVSLRREQEFRA
jgi:S-adenosylmethionine hydrolase